MVWFFVSLYPCHRVTLYDVFCEILFVQQESSWVPDQLPTIRNQTSFWEFKGCFPLSQKQNNNKTIVIVIISYFFLWDREGRGARDQKTQMWTSQFLTRGLAHSYKGQAVLTLCSLVLLIVTEWNVYYTGVTVTGKRYLCPEDWWTNLLCKSQPSSVEEKVRQGQPGIANSSAYTWVHICMLSLHDFKFIKKGHISKVLLQIWILS